MSLRFPGQAARAGVTGTSRDIRIQIQQDEEMGYEGAPRRSRGGIGGVLSSLRSRWHAQSPLYRKIAILASILCCFLLYGGFRHHPPYPRPPIELNGATLVHPDTIDRYLPPGTGGGWSKSTDTIPRPPNPRHRHPPPPPPSFFQSLLQWLGLSTPPDAPTWRDALAPDTPHPYQLPPGDDILPDISDLDLQPPLLDPFPSDLYPELYEDRQSVLKRPDPKAGPTPLPSDAFVSTWRSPSWFDTRGENRKEMPRVQANTFLKESKSRRAERLARQAAVRRAFIYAWQKYKDSAWGHDEVKPASKQTSNPFQQWGASIIDSLETLLIMNLTAEYELCRKHVWQVDFRLVNGADWAYGWRDLSSRDGPDSTMDTSSWLTQGRSTTAHIGTFETGIRYLGGLVGAYDLSGDWVLLDRAKELAKILGKGFDTPSGLIVPRFDAGLATEWLRSGRVSLAEVGSMTLELTRLSQITGDKWYFDKAQRAVDYLEQVLVPRSTLSPLLPLFFDATSRPDQLAGTFGFGAMADSYYEYLIKQHQLVGGATDQYHSLYSRSIDKAMEELFFEIDALPGRNYLTAGKSEHGRKVIEMEHLTCFTGAMMGLGARLLHRLPDLDAGMRLTQLCYWLGAATPSGLPPEITTFYPNLQSALVNASIEPATVYTPEYHIDEHVAGTPPGAMRTDSRYLGRPETIESVFYMWRLTGDPTWQDRGWRMFVDWVDASTAPGGFSSIKDVTRESVEWGDNMESFVFAETFKYYYLLFSDPELISLDDFVFTTEAHPLKLRNEAPGGFWTPSGPDVDRDLGVRASGTDAQLWRRHELMAWSRKPKAVRPAPGKGGGGGRGMGGGGWPG